MSDVNLALTAAGQALMAKINAGNGTIPLEITRIVTSSGTDPDPLDLTALTSEEQEFTITGRTTSGARTTINTYLSNFGNPAMGIPALAQGYPLAQIGFYANDPDDGEILMRISQFENPNYVPAASERAWEYEPTFNIITGNASTVVIQIDPSSSTTKQDVWNSVDISTTSPAALGVRTQYFIDTDMPDYQPVESGSGFVFQDTFDPTTGLDGEGDPIPAANSANNGFYWEASTAGAFTPPGASTSLTFSIGDWLVSNGTDFVMMSGVTTPGAGLFAGAHIVEIRIIADPSNPTGSMFKVALPLTVLEAVIDKNTKESLVQLLAQINGVSIAHITNNDIHVTAAWTTNVDQKIAELITFTQRTDIFVTQAQKDAWTQAVQNALDALALAQTNAGNINDLTGRMTQIEDSLFGDIAANPFYISFGTLSGLLLTYGVWNATLQRVEC
jgi:hypothetical protein